jgi:archaellum component FlaC
MAQSTVRKYQKPRPNPQPIYCWKDVVSEFKQIECDVEELRNDLNPVVDLYMHTINSDTILTVTQSGMQNLFGKIPIEQYNSIPDSLFSKFDCQCISRVAEVKINRSNKRQSVLIKRLKFIHPKANYKCNFRLVGSGLIIDLLIKMDDRLIGIIFYPDVERQTVVEWSNFIQKYTQITEVKKIKVQWVAFDPKKCRKDGDVPEILALSGFLSHSSDYFSSPQGEIETSDYIFVQMKKKVHEIKTSIQNMKKKKKSVESDTASVYSVTTSINGVH